MEGAAPKTLALGTRGGCSSRAGVVPPGRVRRWRHHPGAVSKGLGSAQTGTIIPFALYNLMMVGTFLGLFVAFTSEQEAAYLSIFRSNYWAAAFPPLTEPVKLAGWLAEAHTGRMFAYPFGEAHRRKFFDDALLHRGFSRTVAAATVRVDRAGSRALCARVYGVGTGSLSLWG